MLNILKKLIQGSVLKYLDNMKQPAAILVLLVFYQNLPVSAILEDTSHCQNMSIADTGRIWKILVITVLQILEDPRQYWLYQHCRYWKILENTGNTSIADTGRLGTKLRNVLVYCFFLSCLCVCFERTNSV
jgi:hypothetical protein